MLDLIHWVGPILSFVVGACFGSFGNVIIVRWPEEKSIVTPRSACIKCGVPIRWFDNIPVFSWLWLRGKCRNCSVKISPRYLFVEVLTGLLFLAAYLYLGPSWFLIEIGLFIFGLVTITVIDLEHFLIPDILSLSGIALGLIGAFLNPEREFMDSLYGVLMGGGFLWAVAWLYYLIRKEEGLGGGDIKLIAWIGAVLGWMSVPFVILVSSIVGSVVGITLAIRTKGGMKTVIPYGPFLAVAALIYLFGGDKLATWYLGFFFPWMSQ